MKSKLEEYFAKFHPRNFKFTKMTAFFIAVTLAMAGMVLFSAISRETEFSTKNQLLHDAVEYVPGRVLEVVSEQTSIGTHGIRTGSQYLSVQILKGEMKGEVYEVLNHLHAESSVYAKKGQILNMYLSYNIEDPSIFYVYVSSPERSYINYIIIGIFIIFLSVVGGQTGMRSVFGLAFTFVTIIFLLIPLIVREWPPIPTTMGLSIAMMAVSLISILEFTKKTFVSVISTMSGIIFCCGFYFIFSAALSIFGYHAVDLDYMQVVMVNSGIGVGDFLFCAILISSLGGLIDIAVSVSTSINEIALSNPNSTFNDLFRSGIIVGRDNTASMANTMILAFTGTFFISLVSMRIGGANFSAIINSSDIAIEIIRAVSATLALVLVAPITAFVAAHVYRGGVTKVLQK
ncbi:MAG: YibE/F family protein [Oscillospiraceae bacterium]|nr:YibE/F family protein [Oscillospiraceae bacterium]